MDSSDLAKRMKTYYEQIPKTKLIRRMPVIIRIDGKAFHTFTKGFARPFDEVLIKAMQETTKYLCENIQGCVLGYTQSDEITLVLVDYQRFETAAWFDYEVQKMCSIAASMATMAFNKFFQQFVDDLIWDYRHSLIPQCVELQQKIAAYHTTLLQAADKGAMFDARVFNIPKEEVTNNIYWRQLDATRNSIQMLGQAYFSHSELNEKTCNDIQDMLMLQKGINWNNMPVEFKRGSCCVKEAYYVDNITGLEVENPANESEGVSLRTRWVVDKNIPIFKGDGRAYIDDLVFVGE